MPTMTVAPPQTHASIDTADLAGSITFYRALLGAAPALERHDYARFDVSEPPLVLGLNAVERPAPGPTGALEHLGIRFADEAGLDAARRRLAELAVATDEEPDTECCYARLARVWASDPSGVRWELFVVREAVVAAPSRAGSASACCDPTCCTTMDA
jgi:catechol 2,3-dioxygenase-like lactoylglutathione lyase family enzyme